jgi:hypothetical protein
MLMIIISNSSHIMIIKYNDTATSIVENAVARKDSHIGIKESS